jgi:glyoxalase family protein
MKEGEKLQNKEKINGVFGIHHVTAITGDPNINIHFYSNILGLRFVKLTVNQDDPSSYHLYYGDELGRPGTCLTFFHWPKLPKGHRGTSEVRATAFLIPENSINYWINRLKSKHVECSGPEQRFDKEQVITLLDPDGLQLELVAHESAHERDVNLWKKGSVPIEHAIRGFYSVTLAEEGYERTASILTNELGFVATRCQGNRFRFEISNTSRDIPIEEKQIEGFARIVDVICIPDSQDASIGIGSVHHVAWRTPNDKEQKNLRQNIIIASLNATPVINRFYFHSVYFREPGGILFEIATNTPGFTVDEKAEELGMNLVLPPWFESIRKDLEKILPKIHRLDKDTNPIGV